ncbi:C45 family autoproteolytic acyltransferase/hydolase [Ruminococcus flavefaciens]|uniref:Acyl-coenzyme A:6-aminopenicillanic acid acyl-transferase n=1 Tax=Ruminococcus flavefaciens TaxID=1265 RepID=A0A1M7MRA9_RUMFL|nr:C45 family autoproteolytic acyltransferase/hydolase [Ruminococcus flavefaciens]SHM93074.1 hypothetical protein SAMN04487860_1266 [Ruminococcus flavefaciens]
MKRRKISAVCAVLMSAVMLSGCGRLTYDDYVVPESDEAPLTPVANNCIENNYEGTAPTKEETKEVYTSSDGLCRIENKNSYFDVTLDYENGSYKDVGAAYAEAILLARPDYGEMLEQYLYENINSVANGTKEDYSEIEKRVMTFYTGLDDDYRQELEGFAEKLGDKDIEFKQDGKLSRDEVILMEFIPDALRGTACSAISANGNTTATGERITCRVLEWQLGSENQLCQAHSLVHYKNGEKSFTSVTYMGFFPILTAVNKNGVLLGELDVGSSDAEYTCEGKTSYTYAMRYALENMDTAKECAEYMAENSKRFPYCVNILATDKNDAFIAELVVTDKEGEGETVIRDGNTKLNKKLKWDDTNYICSVNSFSADGNTDKITYNESNLIRWNKYNRLFCGQKDMTLERFKELMTCEKINDKLVNIRGEGLVHMVIADYSTNTLQAILTGTEGVIDSPEFIDLGSWE